MPNSRQKFTGLLSYPKGTSFGRIARIFNAEGCDSKELFIPYKISQVDDMLEFMEKKLIRDMNKEFSEFMEDEDDLISVTAIH